MYHYLIPLCKLPNYVYIMTINDMDFLIGKYMMELRIYMY